MNDDNRLKTGAMLSELWDGLPIKRIRATDGITILPGRRLAMHVMIQPDAASAFLSNKELQDQGLLSRILVARPKSMSGARPYKEMVIDDDDAAIKAYGARLLSILEAAPALAEGKRNELDPRALPLSPDATTLWIGFHDHVEAQLAPDGPLAPIKGFAAKAAEQAARIAGVITIVEDLHAPEITAEVMAGVGMSTKPCAFSKPGCSTPHSSGQQPFWNGCRRNRTGKPRSAKFLDWAQTKRGPKPRPMKPWQFWLPTIG